MSLLVANCLRVRISQRRPAIFIGTLDANKTMFVTNGRDVFDYDLDLLVEVLGVIDRRIAIIEGQIKQSEDPDGVGHFDRMEAIIGLGFVACQQYINATWKQLAKKSLNRWEVIASAPSHACGRSFAEMVDSAANYWKHHDEWPSRQEAATRKVIEAITPSTADYVLGNVLFCLVQPRPPRFASIVHELTLWRDLQIDSTA